MAKNSRVKVRIPKELKSTAVLVKPRAQAERVNNFIVSIGMFVTPVPLARLVDAIFMMNQS